MNHFLQDDNVEIEKLNIRLYKPVITTSIDFKDELGSNNGSISTEVDLSNRNNLYYKNDSGVVFPVNNSYQRFYEQLSDSVNIVFADGEKSIFNTTNSIGRLTILPDITRRGSRFQLKAHGIIEASPSNKSFTLRTYLGESVIEEDIILLPNLPNGSYFDMTLDMLVYDIGGTGEASIKTFGRFEFISNNGNPIVKLLDAENSTTYQTTQEAEANVSIEWNQESSSVISFHEVSIFMLN